MDGLLDKVAGQAPYEAIFFGITCRRPYNNDHRTRGLENKIRSRPGPMMRRKNYINQRQSEYNKSLDEKHGPHNLQNNANNPKKRSLNAVMKIRELALLIEGTVEGDENADIMGLSGIESAKQGDLTFAIDEDKLALAEKSKTACVLTTKGMRKSTKPLIRVNNPKLSFIIAYNALDNHPSQKTFIHSSAVVADSVKLGKNVQIGSHASLEDNVVIGDHTIIESGCVIKKNCSIGSRCHFYPNVVLYENMVLKNNIVLHGGVVVGSDGFGYVKDQGQIHKFPQLGRVIIEDNVEIGANTTIDRGSLNDTIIGAGSKIDNLRQIAHNVKLGKNVLMAAQSVIAGSSTIGDNVYMSGQVGIVDNVSVGKNVIIGGQSCVIGDIKDNAVVWGMPARPIAQTKKQMAALAWITKNFSIFSKMIKDKK